ncbi:TraI/MobA(P) family conjugative relaxase [Rouxiella badensis]|uniref:TraI/MobA(P) family conjugative relaxase n=1 Tax=Rouxiella badensis TaxID=1646377 RepID=UPI0017887341|nr:TraI/MobA(P) family conjugative relaxase [Rouxiella badensis]QOI58025.1 relaxase/mobilization nuclease domain-containing protein [Rouxiella badensis subsp. acadiensis]
MNIIIPPKRRDGRSSFVQLVGYVSVRDDISLKDEIKEDPRFKRPARARGKVFERLVEYMNRTESLAESQLISVDARGESRVSVDGVISQHNLLSLESTASEMNGVAMQNSRIKDPVYHFILSWQEDENPTDDQIFKSAQYALRRMDMQLHQYMASIHRDTDNVHVHVVANRVNPLTFKAVSVHGDADKMQRICRELELKFNFKVDNGSWVRDADNQIVRAKRGYKKAPRGAATLEHFGDRESLYTYAVTHCRKDINAMFRDKSATWERMHAVFDRAGLKLERRGEGMIVRDRFNPGQTPIKASRLHTSMTLSRIVPKVGEFAPSPLNDADVHDKHVHAAYNDQLHMRDQGARQVRRIARAEARQKLKDDYQAYRKSWVKPDLRIAARSREIADSFRAQKVRIRHGVGDPHMRKLMYNVVEFEREKAMAGLRIQLKAEREQLREEGKARPMTYRVWTEQEALKGSQAAVSQLRGWAYREGRKNRVPFESDNIIYCAPADDTPVLKADGFSVRVHRDGSAVYSQKGREAIIDRGDTVEVRHPHDYGGINTVVAIDMVSWKSGEKVEFDGGGYFVASAIGAAARHNQVHTDSMVVPTNDDQLERIRQDDRTLRAHQADNAAYVATAEARYEQRQREQTHYVDDEHDNPSHRGTFKP